MTDAQSPTGARRAERAWRVLTVLAGLFLVAFGGVVVLAGEADDSPGLGGLGLITALIGAAMLVRTVRANGRGNRRRPR